MDVFADRFVFDFFSQLVFKLLALLVYVVSMIAVEVPLQELSGLVHFFLFVLFEPDALKVSAFISQALPAELPFALPA